MAQQVRRPGRTTASRPRRDPNVRRSVVYGIPTLPVDQDPTSPTYGRVIPGAAPIVGYIGKSVQTVYQRQQQHRDTQSFADTICGGSWVIEEGWWTDAELSAREEWWIRNGAVLVRGQKPQRPVYNDKFNTGNPLRVEVGRAVEQRQIREPGWVKPANGAPVPRQRTRGPGRDAVRAKRRRSRLRWTRRRIRAAVFAGVWVALFAGFWWAGWDVWHGWDGPRNAAVGASLVLVAVGLLLPGKRRRRRRSRR